MPILVRLCRAAVPVAVLSFIAGAASAAGLPYAAESFADARLAYIDPGAGSLIIQALVAAAAAGFVTGKLYWRRLKALFGGGSAQDVDDDGDLVSRSERDDR